MSNCYCQLEQNRVLERPTSRVKSPETPQEVVAAGAALVEVDETGTGVCVAGVKLDDGCSFDDGISLVVTVTVTMVGASDVISCSLIIESILRTWCGLRLLSRRRKSCTIYGLATIIVVRP